MIKVLIVDDEKIVRIAMRTMIKWEENGFLLVGEARNGNTAISMIDKLNPDIVITDLVMSGMDGIELIKTLKNKGFPGKIIVLSNYGEYESVREAMKYGAMDYLLKITMKGDEFIKLLKQAGEILTTERAEKNEVFKMKLEINENRSQAKNNILKELLEDDDAYSDEISHKVTQYCPVLNQKSNFLFYIVIDNLEQTASRNKIKDKKLMAFSIINIVREILSSFPQFEVVELNNCCTVGILPIELNETSLKLDQYAIEISSMVEMYLNITVSIVISDVFVRLNGMREAYKDCIQALNKRFYTGNKSIIHQNRAVFGREQNIEGYSSLMGNVLKGIDNYDMVYVRTLIESVLFDAEAGNVHPESLKRLLLQVMDGVISVISNRGADCFNEASIARSELLKAETMSEFKKNLFTIIEIINAKIHERKQGVYRREIQKVMEYIERHINEKITLNMIAREVNLNESYLCRIFKIETGKNLTAYMNELKIDKAKMLLKEPEAMIKEVADRLGFDNQFYFHRIFRKYAGISPSEFKDNATGKNSIYNGK